ncbi:hypothetical protein SAMN05660209_01407 [Geodermatophilus africanus]|uniref:Short chain dehydrogenase n=1 Tax=Geodermatophilus africanus TaxID=1137993 RepID=A0A1H3EXI1_9ACTN|nr:hypothetical protein SAMN05660209_01407 [Geodermatophilus africanus]
MEDLDGRIAVVTGGGTGIGQATAVPSPSGGATWSSPDADPGRWRRRSRR